MNIGITTSFVVGGLLLLSILQMNLTVNNDAAATTMQIAAKNQVQAITQTLTADFNRMGYNVNSSKQVILNFKSNKITFRGDIDESHPGVETITWNFTNGNYKATDNPDDHKLIRTGSVSAGSGSKPLTYPAVSFKLTPYNWQHVDLSDSTQKVIKEQTEQIKIEVLCESPEAILANGPDGKKVYGRSFWQQTIIPPSLHIWNLKQ